MKLAHYMILFCFLLLKCNPDMEKNCLVCEMQGDWIGEDKDEIVIVHQNEVLEGQPWLTKYLELYSIKENEIIVDSARFRQHEGVKKRKNYFNYRVSFLSDDTLKILKYDPTVPADTQILSLVKLNSIYEYRYEKLSISGSPCDGACPVFEIELNAGGEVEFRGESYTDKLGDYVGIVEQNDLLLIEKSINKIDWRLLEKEYTSELNGLQCFNVEMELKNGEKYTIKTNSPEPKALNILIFHTFRIVENSNLKVVE